MHVLEFAAVDMEAWGKTTGKIDFIAAVDATGLIQPKGEGRTVLVIRHGQEQAQIPVEVSGLTKPPPVSLNNMYPAENPMLLLILIRKRGATK